MCRAGARHIFKIFSAVISAKPLKYLSSSPPPPYISSSLSSSSQWPSIIPSLPSFSSESSELPDDSALSEIPDNGVLPHLVNFFAAWEWSSGATGELSSPAATPPLPPPAPVQPEKQEDGNPPAHMSWGGEYYDLPKTFPVFTIFSDGQNIRWIRLTKKLAYNC